MWYVTVACGYVFPLIIGAALLASSRLLGRPAPDRWQRWFWVTWTLWALLLVFMTSNGLFVEDAVGKG
jgi:hypothetical protein